MLVSDIQSDNPWISRAVSESTVVVQLVSQKSVNLWISRYIGQSAVNGEKLDEVDSFKYLGTVVTDQGSKPEVLSRIAQTTAALARLKTIWSDTHISLEAQRSD